MKLFHSRLVLVAFFAFAVFIVAPTMVLADMEDRAFIGETSGVVVTDFHSDGVDLGSKNEGDTRFRIAGVPLDITGEGTRCGNSINSVEVSAQDHVTRIELRVPKGSISTCPLPERTLRVMLPLAIPDAGSGGSLKRLIKLHFRKYDEQGLRTDTLRVIKVDYVKKGNAVAHVRISDPYRH